MPKKVRRSRTDRSRAGPQRASPGANYEPCSSRQFRREAVLLFEVNCELVHEGFDEYVPPLANHVGHAVHATGRTKPPPPDRALGPKAETVAWCKCRTWRTANGGKGRQAVRPPREKDPPARHLQEDVGLRSCSSRARRETLSGRRGRVVALVAYSNLAIVRGQYLGQLGRVLRAVLRNQERHVGIEPGAPSSCKRAYGSGT